MIGEKLGPYEILSEIGSGGMGSVYKARDTRLGRIVAIKKVKEQHSERFKQEARSIAALNHPNICQIFDISDDYLVLEYVEGQPLSSPLPEQEAVRVAIQIATALEAAHKKGIIHRDLKPSNIMISEEGSVKLLDFGLAKLYEQDQSISNLPTEEFPATQAGAILGTVAYMSPEQAQGQPADARSDIFSFGLVLYEMLSGRRAFSGDSTPEVMAALLRDEPAPLKTSPVLEKIMKRCLEKNPADRYQRMSELKVDLVKATAKVTVSSEEPQPSIAVLPFVNMSGDKEQEYFSDGLAEEIINALTKIPGLQVIARTSAFAFKGKDQDITEIAKALRVSNILEGSVRKSGNRIRVTAQLIEASKGTHLWSERYDRDLMDVFAIQDEIATAIADAMKVKLSVTQLAKKRYEPNLAAHESYLKARYLGSALTPESLKLCKAHYEKAIQVDPNYPLPWFGLASLYWFLGNQGIMPAKAAYTKCQEAALRALELDTLLPEAHGILGVLKATQFDWVEAEKEFHRALELGPNVWDVWFHYGGWYLLPMRRLSEAIDVMQKAVNLDPLSPIPQLGLGNAYLINRQYERAMETYRHTLELNPHFSLAYLFLGLTLILLGNPNEGIETIETGDRLLERTPLSMALLSLAYSRVERIEDAQTLLAELQGLVGKANVSSFHLGIGHLGLCEIDKSLDFFEKAIEERNSLIFNFFASPFFDPIRSHPRYKSLVRKMNLEP